MRLQKQSALRKSVPNVTAWAKVFITTFILYAGSLYADNPQVIVHPSVEQTELSRNTARAIFSMRLQRWQDGSAITVFVLPDTHPTHRQFSRETLALFPHQLRRSWDRYVYSGIGTAPIELESVANMIVKIATTPGSIGYSQQEILNENVRMLPVR